MALGEKCPAIAELERTLKQCFPAVNVTTLGPISPADRHTSGVAMDIFLHYNQPAEKSIADRIISALIAHVSEMEWSDIIYTDTKDGKPFYFHISPGGHGYAPTGLKKSPYTKDQKHTDHIHVDWVDFNLKNTGQEYLRNPYKWSSAAKRTGFGPALAADLSRIPAEPPAPAVPPPGWMQGWWSVVQDGDTYYYFLGPGAFVEWTYRSPSSKSAPMVDLRNRGTAAWSPTQGLVLTWDEWGGMSTIETFPKAVTALRNFSGTSNRGGPLQMAKLF